MSQPGHNCVQGGIQAFIGTTGTNRPNVRLNCRRLYYILLRASERVSDIWHVVVRSNGNFVGLRRGNFMGEKDKKHKTHLLIASIFARVSRVDGESAFESSSVSASESSAIILLFSPVAEPVSQWIAVALVGSIVNCRILHFLQSTTANSNIIRHHSIDESDTFLTEDICTRRRLWKSVGWVYFLFDRALCTPNHTHITNTTVDLPVQRHRKFSSPIGAHSNPFCVRGIIDSVV